MARPPTPSSEKLEYYQRALAAGVGTERLKNMADISNKELVKRLSRVPLFSKLTAKHLKHIAQHGKQLSWSEGKEGVVQGSNAHAFYLILDGSVEVTRDGDPVARMHNDDFFGEVAMLTGNPRNASVTATTDTDFFVLSRTAFTAAITGNPQLSMQLMAAMAERQGPGRY